MFTGLIEILGTVASRRATGGATRMEIVPGRPLLNLQPGESIAINGACLTAEADSRPDRLVFFLSGETLKRTTLGDFTEGRSVNLERSLRLGDRLGGHLVMGHVDAVGTVRRWERRGEGWELEVAYPAALAPLLAEKGSVAVDGISLTVARLRPESFTVAVIPHTAQATNLAQAAPGARVNLEADLLARYATRALEALRGREGLGIETLRRAGY
jgi:riboflavin synthase